MVARGRAVFTMLVCPQCTSLIPDTQEKCLTCGYNAGPPNVRAAEAEDELKVLEQRYEATLESARQKGCLSMLQKFSEAVNTSCATINVDARFLHFFATGNSLFANYEHGVAGNARKPASFSNDAARRAAGSTLFGEYAGDIIYAALSLTGLGLHSYGPYALTLKDVAIRQRATVLEENSFDFVRRHNLLPGNKRPAGCFASWTNRNKLAVAKLGPYITPQTSDDDLHHLFLSGSGNRATDDFLEVQIYGTFDLAAIESVRGNSKGGSKEERSLLRLAKSHLTRAGIMWIEHD